MRFIGWMYDIAREQSPGAPFLRDLLTRSLEAGYNAVGFYLEHRFAYPSAPWAAAEGCLTPEMVRQLSREFQPRGLRIIPFLNTLGHLEGFIRSAGGEWLAEGETSWGSEQICPTREPCVAFARDLVADAIAAFDDEWVHLGGDETRQLGQCPQCQARMADGGVAKLYGEYYGELCRWVLQQKRRPCLWGDMLIQYPDAIACIPPQTVIFDWHYDQRPIETVRMFHKRGFDVVCCPAIRSFTGGWCDLELTRRNVDEHAEDARAARALGVLVTTWVGAYFAPYAPYLPLVYAAGRRLAGGLAWDEAIRATAGEGYAVAAEVLGVHVPRLSPALRSSIWGVIRESLGLRGDPFVLWRRWRSDAAGPVGDEILHACEQAETAAPPNDPIRFGVALYRAAIGCVRRIDEAAARYSERDHAGAAAALRGAMDALQALRPALVRFASDGGSKPDVGRLDGLVERLAGAAQRIEAAPACAAQRPTFLWITDALYTAGDQAAWRLTLGRGPTPQDA